MVFAASFLLVAASVLMARLRYLPVMVALAGWVAMQLLNFVTPKSDWLVYLFDASWIALLALAVAAPFLRRWRQFAIVGLVLFNTYTDFFRSSPLLSRLCFRTGGSRRLDSASTLRI